MPKIRANYSVKQEAGVTIFALCKDFNKYTMFEGNISQIIVVVVLMLYVRGQQLWSWQDIQLT